MNKQAIQQAAQQFAEGEPDISLLGEGLIHKTYKVVFKNSAGPAIVLQCINTNTFPHPENILYNYRLIEKTLQDNNGFSIPSLIPTRLGKASWTDAYNQTWRAISYVDNSCTVLIPASAEEAYAAARCFGLFTRQLSTTDPPALKIIIPGFHDLAYRYRQFEEAIARAGIERLLKATHVIAELRQRQSLVEFYNGLQNNPAFPLRVMHHDCKMSNVLLHPSTRQAICPIDLDTTQPGYFFSDLGDMIRSMAVTVDENSTRWEDIAVRAGYYDAIVKGYLEGMGDVLTKEELTHLHKAGLLLVFMQSLRFVTDFLNNDTYYQTTYPEQNLNRALNQLILLEKLEEFIQ